MRAIAINIYIAILQIIVPYKSFEKTKPSNLLRLPEIAPQLDALPLQHAHVARVFAETLVEVEIPGRLACLAREK